MMLAITFDFDPRLLTKIRVLPIEVGTGKYKFPNNILYDPLLKFMVYYKNRYQGYPFNMFRMLHVAGVNMLKGKLNGNDLKSSLFVSGGLYLALNQTHQNLAIEQTFGDFTSSFSHQFGVALALMSLSEAFQISWDRLTPIPVSGQKSMDYEVKLPSGTWLMLEAKGVSGNSRASARSSIYQKKTKANTANKAKVATAMVGVIVQAARDNSTDGCIEFVDPPFEPSMERRSDENQIAGRFLHYSAVARFAGLDSWADAFMNSARDALNHHSNHVWQISRTAYDRSARRVRPYLREPQGNTINILNRDVLGVQWRLGTATGATQNVWFYQGADMNVLETVMQRNEIEIPFFHFHNADDSQMRLQDNQVIGFLPDGSFFGVGLNPIEGFRQIDRSYYEDRQRSY